MSEEHKIFTSIVWTKKDDDLLRAAGEMFNNFFNDEKYQAAKEKYDKILNTKYD